MKLAYRAAYPVQLNNSVVVSELRVVRPSPQSRMGTFSPSPRETPLRLHCPRPYAATHPLLAVRFTFSRHSLGTGSEALHG